MLDDEEYGSDSADEDYVPVAVENSGSEKDSGEEEDFSALLDDASEDTKEVTGKKRAQKKTKKKVDTSTNRKRHGGIKLEGDEELAAAAATEKAEDESRKKELEESLVEERALKKEHEEKKKSDSLWASFMSDMPGRPKPKPASNTSTPPGGGIGRLGLTSHLNKNKTTKNSPTASPAPKSDKVTITKEFDFAGELIKVTKEVDANSKEAKEEQKLKEKEEQEGKPTCGPALGLKRPGGGGLGSVLGKINKKPKMGTLQKSKLDWESFKSNEGISEELQTYNKGRDGFIERQQFLNRTDHRQFEQERQVRQSSKR